jgi:hypothetical protein
MESWQTKSMFLQMFLMSISFITLGLKGLFEKKPFLLSSRWMWLIMLFCFGPSLLMSLSTLLEGRYFDWIFVLSPLLVLFALFVMWRQMSGYMAFGITDDSFREALQAALKAQSLAYEERLTKIHLKDLKVDLQVSIQGWMGVGQIRISNSQHDILKGIVTEMNSYFRSNQVAINLFTCIVYLILGTMLLLLGLGFFSQLS